MSSIDYRKPVDVTKAWRELEFDRPFYILDKNGGLKDVTVWRKDRMYPNEPNRSNAMLRMYFHIEGFWINPPTDSNMEYQAQQKIAKYGVVYLPDGYVEGYQSTPYMERGEYISNFAEKVERLLATLTLPQDKENE